MSTSSLASCASDGTGNLSTGGSFSVPLTKETFFDKCPRCKVQFDFLKRTNNISSKVPLILNCKHTVCEDCIRKLAIMNVALCPVCREKFTVLKSQLDSLTELFVPHYSLIGYLLWTKNSPIKGNINWMTTGLTLKSQKNPGLDSFEMNSVADIDKSDENFEDDETEKPLLSLEFDKCPDHNDSFMNIHCEHCNKTVCCYCFVENHGGHTPVYLYKLSDIEVSGLQQLKTEMEIVLKQLQMSQMKAKRLKTFDLTTVENDMKNFFFNLHASLQLVEQSKKKQLQTFKVNGADLDVVDSTLKSAVYRVKHVLNLLNTTSTKQINIRALYEEVQELKKIPCCLVSDQGTLDPIEFSVASDFFEDLEENIVLKRTTSLEYTLLPIEDWNKFQNEESELGTSKIEENSLCAKEFRPEASTSVQKEQKTYSKKGRSSNEVGRTRVVLTHLNDLNSFYVQKCSIQNALRSMNKYIGNRPKRRLTPDTVKEGLIYGVLYETRHANYWRRGQLMNIVRRGPNDFLYSMFYIDYGNTQHVTVDKLKELDLHIVKRGPYAFECKLTNPDHVDFDSKAHLRLPQIIGDKELYLQFVRKQKEGVQEVDLLIPTSTGNLISIRNLLVNDKPTASDVQEIVIPKNLKYFKNSKKFSPGQEYQVKVTHVKDPFNIYVQLVQNIDVLEKMKKEMLNYYEHHRSVACVPIEDTDVVVKYQDEFQGKWHRGRITSVDSANQKVVVYFIDWGKSVVVPWSDIKLLAEDFTKIECQAITVKLADIVPENINEPWPQKAIDFLKEQVLINNDLRMVVDAVDPLEVALFQICPSADVCLNAAMVEKNLAVSSGNFSKTLYWPKSQEVQVEEDDDEFSFQLIKKSEEVLIENDDVELKHGLKQQVNVIRFENPNLIYVKLAKYREIEEEMNKELHIHYSAQRETKNVWKPSEYCVIYDAARKQYFRGTIRGATGPDSYLVYLYDYARELKVPKSCIFIQDKYFKRFACYVFKCRLAHIKPAGDKGDWSRLAIEMLQKIFATYKIIHIKKIETNKKQKMLGVIMWYCLTKPAKALEPAKNNFISINKTLIESGVAFSTAPPPNTNDIQESSESDDNREVNNSIPEAGGKNKDNSKDWYEMICEEELLKSKLASWPSAMPLQNREFDAVLTCVDSEGCFSVRDDEMHAVYLDLEQNLNAKFNSLKLPPNENVDWKPGEMCTIWYDNSWYRGVVIEVVDSNEISVEMIDFGSEHLVTKNHLYKQIMFPDMPPLVNKVKLYDVYSKHGQWSADDVDKLLEIVADRVKVVVKGDKNVVVPFAEVYLPSGLTVNDLIVQKCSHLYRRDNKAVVRTLVDEDKDKDDLDESGTEDNLQVNESSELDGSESNINESSDDGMAYIYASISEPSNCKMFVIRVLKCGSEYNAVLNILNDNEAITDSEEMNVLMTDIQERIDEQPVVEEFYVNEPCVGLYTEKNMWCRATIYDVDNLEFGYVSVFFVDYGAVDMMNIDNLKVMKPEWFNLPVYNRMAIINIELVQKAKAENVLTQMNNLGGKSVRVKIFSEDPLRVHLYDGKYLCYQNLINCGIIKALS